MTEDLFGFVLFDSENDEDTVKTINSAIVNTMKLSPEFEGSKLSAQLESLKGSQQSSNSGQGNVSSNQETPRQETPVKHESVPQNAPTYNEPPMDWDSEIPF